MKADPITTPRAPLPAPASPTPLRQRNLDHQPPRRSASVVFAVKASVLQVRRGLQDLAAGTRRSPRGHPADYSLVLAESRTPLWTESDAGERALELGKVHNLRRAVRRLDGAILSANGLFSFWKEIGRATRLRGYVRGRQLREGCLYPAVGGGLCQLSNALYDVALRAGCTIVERHPHSLVVPGSAAAGGRDATVAWNYIDLRFSPPQPLLVESRLTETELVVRFRGRGPATTRAFSARNEGDVPEQAPARAARPITRISPRIDVRSHSCHTCGVEQCFRHEMAAPSHMSERTAFLVDECWPEFRRHLTTVRAEGDVLALPLDGARWNRPRYGWEVTGYARVTAATWTVLTRSLRARRLGAYGARRLQAQIAASEALARRFARALTSDVTAVCIDLSFLPFLWRDGHLGGRPFDVLMTRLPLHALHSRLDAALARHPDRTTLGEYRAPEWMVDAEAEALAVARRVVTPHAGVAALFPGRAVELSWEQPPCRPRMTRSRRLVAFPGPTAARKGAYEVRDAARELGFEVLLLGSELEGAGFWEGVQTYRDARRDGGDWLDGIAAVVQPALVEDRPRALLTALSAGVPVVATATCGLGDAEGVATVPYGDPVALGEALLRILPPRHT